MTDVRELASRLARARQPVLVTGENGVCKGLIARLVHLRSSRSEGPYIPLGIVGQPAPTLSLRLFGELPGEVATTSARLASAFSRAHGGTLFLDEVGELPLELQARLLRAIEDGVPGPDNKPASVRIVCSTSRDLTDLIAAGRFREDLLFRIAAARVHVPPLRDRREDVRPLVHWVMAQQPRQVTLTEAAWIALEHYYWPGNLRELTTVVEQIAEFSAGDQAGVDDLPEALRGYAGGSVRPVHERRRHIADDLFTGLVDGRYQFWRDVYEMFMRRDLTRADLRGIVERGLVATAGSYRSLLLLFGMPEGDYKRLHNFLAAHDCALDFRPFRLRRPIGLLPPPAALLARRPM